MAWCKPISVRCWWLRALSGLLGLLCLPGPGGMAIAGIEAAPDQFLAAGWHTEDGLPDGSITALAQTPDGYLWIGTFNGLARFDGVRFTVFDGRRAPVLAGQSITGLLVDAAGRLWIAGAAGTLFRGEGGRFERVPGLPSAAAKEAPVPLRFTHSRWLRGTGLAEDATGDIWVQTGNARLARVRNGELVSAGGAEGWPAAGIVALVNNSQRIPWLLDAGGLRQWEAASGQWVERLRTPGLAQGEPVVCAGRDGGLWLAAPRGSWAFGGGRVVEFREGRLREELPPTPWATNSPRSQVTALLADREGRMWLGTQWGGVLRQEAEAWHPPIRAGVLTQCRVTCLFEDRQGAVWVGTLGDGLHRLTRRPVAVLRLPEPAKEHLVNTVCATRDGSVWVGTDGAGAFRYRAGQFTPLGTSEGLGSPVVLSFCEDGAGDVWCGTTAGLARWQGDSFERITAPEVGQGYVLAQLADRQGNLCLGTPLGVVRHQAGRFTLHRLGVPGTVEIRALAEDATGNLWVGTIAQGLFRLREGQVERFGLTAGLTHPDARSLWCDGDGGVWVGTLGGGLFRGYAGRFAAVTPADGLPDATINGSDPGRGGQFVVRLVQWLLRSAAAVAQGGPTRSWHDAGVPAALAGGRAGLPGLFGRGAAGRFAGA
jgi:ligand-binding sensor domain-containing protein